jgi:hypothetical protein
VTRIAFSALTGLVWALTGCAAAPPPKDEAPERPFIKLANREMALLLAWRGSPPSPGDQQRLERLLVERLRSAYRVPIESHRENGAYQGISPELFLGMVERGIDDVVVVEVEQLPRPEPRLEGAVSIIVLNDQRVAHRLKIDEVAGKSGALVAERFADFVYLRLSREWTDPGAEPTLDPLRAADELADKSACDHAVRIYEKVFATQKPQTVIDIQRFGDAERRYEICRRKVASRDAIQKDKGAIYRVDLDFAGISEPLKQAFIVALEKSTLKAKLAERTDKPVRIFVSPGILTLQMRYHPDRYEAATKEQSPFLGGSPAIWIEPFLEPMQQLADLRDRAIDLAPSGDRLGLSRIQLELRLEKVLGDRFEIQFAELDGRALPLDEARIKVGDRATAEVTSAVPKVAQNGAFVIGAIETPNGDITPAGLVYRFFELKGPPPARYVP